MRSEGALADEQDLEALKSGDPDMVRRDFRKADLSGMDLRGRDFSGAHFEGATAHGADFSGSNLQGANFVGFAAERANFSEVRAEGTVFVNVNFKGAIFDRAKLNRSSFTRVNFEEASLLSAELRKARLNEGSNFASCHTNAATLFDEVTIFRPLAREAAFRFYRVERGQLARVVEGEAPAEAEEAPASVEATPDRSMSANVEALRQAAVSALEALAAVTPSEDAATDVGMGHNGPPADAALTRLDYEAVTATLVSLRDVESKPDRDYLDEARATLVETGKKIVVWARAKLAEIEGGFFSQLGATLADPHRIVIAWLAVSGRLNEVAGVLVGLIGGG